MKYLRRYECFFLLMKRRSPKQAYRSQRVYWRLKRISGNGITDIQKRLVLMDDRYRFSVWIYQNATSVVETWYVAYVIPKEYAGKVDLDIEYYLTTDYTDLNN